MNTKLTNYLQQKGRSAWFYTHLKKDPEFKREATELRKRVVIATPHGGYRPSEIRDFELLDDPDKEAKAAEVEAFMAKWNIHWDYVLLNFLINEDENDLPPMFKAGFAVGTEKDRNMFEVQIPFSVQREDLDYLWLMLLAAKRDVGIDITKRPHKNKYNSSKTEIAYSIWKLRSTGKSWTEVVKEINKKYKREFDIKSAQRHLKTYGYYC